MRLKQTMKDHIIESAARIICLGNNWMSPSLLRVTGDEDGMRIIRDGARDKQEMLIGTLLDTAAGRAALKSTIKEVMEAYKDEKTIKFLTKKHVRNIIRLITICEDAGTSDLEIISDLGSLDSEEEGGC